jgi:putative hemolysin
LGGFSAKSPGSKLRRARVSSLDRAHGPCGLPRRAQGERAAEDQEGQVNRRPLRLAPAFFARLGHGAPGLSFERPLLLAPRDRRRQRLIRRDHCARPVRRTTLGLRLARPPSHTLTMNSAASALRLIAHSRAEAHIVDALIEERAPHYVASPFWPAMRPALYALLGYHKARRLADDVAGMGGQRAFEHLSALLSLRTEAVGLERIPRRGRLMVVCNHPASVADGVAVYDLLRPIRPDLCFFANADIFRVCPALDELMIPVEWAETRKTRERTRHTLQRAKEAFEAERAVIIFPAGQLARRDSTGRIRDEAWASSALSLARRHNAPVAPMHLSGPSSTLFHFFDRFSTELRDVTLFHELLNKRRARYRLRVGPLVAAADLDPDVTAATAAMKAYIEDVLPAELAPPAL